MIRALRKKEIESIEIDQEIKDFVEMYAANGSSLKYILNELRSRNRFDESVKILLGLMTKAEKFSFFEKVYIKIYSKNKDTVELAKNTKTKLIESQIFECIQYLAWNNETKQKKILNIGVGIFSVCKY